MINLDSITYKNNEKYNENTIKNSHTYLTILTEL